MAELLPQTTSIQTIYSWFTEGKIFVNRRYQRKLVWTAIEKQKLIESIQKKLSNSCSSSNVRSSTFLSVPATLDKFVSWQTTITRSLLYWTSISA